MNPPLPPDDLRRLLVTLKATTLQAQAARMGLKLPTDPISAAAMAKIEKDVAELAEADLAAQIAHWTELSRRAVNALAPPPTDSSSHG